MLESVFEFFEGFVHVALVLPEITRIARYLIETIYSTVRTEENWIIRVGNKTGNDCSCQVNLQVLYIREYPATVSLSILETT